MAMLVLQQGAFAQPWGMCIAGSIQPICISDRVIFVRSLQYWPVKRRHSHLAVVILPDEAIAFQVYRLLQRHGISPENLAIVGAGYSTPERVGLLSPTQLVERRAIALGINSAFFGAALASLLLIIGAVKGHPITWLMSATLICGLCGAMIGALLGLWREAGAASVYHDHLIKGRYLLLLEGSGTLVSWGQEVLRSYTTSRLNQ
jgi:hypothetical protein